MKNINKILTLFTFAFSTSYIAVALDQYEFYRDVPKTSEKEIIVKIESSFKKIVISKGYTDKIFTIQTVPDDYEAPNVLVKYNIDDDRGFLKIDLSEDCPGDPNKEWTQITNKTPGLEENTWYIKLNNSLPIKLFVDLGGGFCAIDISGLILKEFKLNTGLSSTSVSCNEPNAVVMDIFDIEAGLAKFYGSRLANANFKTLKFEGGVGSYSLDFGGSLKREASVNVNIGFGSMNIFLPPSVGAQVKYDEGFLSSHTFEDFRSMGNGKYISNNFNNSDSRLNIKIESGVGNIKIRRVKE